MDDDKPSAPPTSTQTRPTAGSPAVEGTPGTGNPPVPDDPQPQVESTRGAATRGRILDVARDMFIEKGYEKVSLREIAEAVGITKAALYYYFPTKEKLFEALVQPLFDMQRMSVNLLAGPPDLQEWAAKLPVFLDWILEQRKLFVLLQNNQTSLHDLMHREGFLEEHLAMHERLHEAFEDETVPLATRVRLAGAVMFILGVVAFPHGGPFERLPSSELRPVVIEAVNDLLLPGRTRP